MENAKEKEETKLILTDHYSTMTNKIDNKQKRLLKRLQRKFLEKKLLEFLNDRNKMKQHRAFKYK